MNLEDLADSLECSFIDPETFLWLDPATGKTELWGEEAADEAEAEGWDLDDRGAIRIDTVSSDGGYADIRGSFHRPGLGLSGMAHSPRPNWSRCVLTRIATVCNGTSLSHISTKEGRAGATAQANTGR